jgi:ATP-binding cassette subfamily F protein 3
VFGENLKVGYFAQHQLEVLDLQASPFLHIQRISPTATEQKIRNYLGGFDFHNDKALDPIKDFSGGEKARVALALIVWQKPNLLLLDEPTNHLDLEMRHALTMALQGYEGALVVISHDRHLLRNTVDEFYLVADGEVQEFDGDLKDYQNWLKNFSRVETIEVPKVDEVPMDKKVSRQQSAEDRKKLAPLVKKIKTLEESIEKFQSQISLIEAKLADANIYNDDHKDQLKKILSEQTDVKRKLAAIEEEWLECQGSLENA